KELRRLAPAQAGVNALAFSPDGRLLAVAAAHSPPGKNPCLLIYDVQTGRLLHQLSRGKGALSLAFSADGRALASGHTDNQVRLWEVATGGQRVAFRHGDRPRALAFSPDGTLLASPTNHNPECWVRSKDDDKRRVWDPLPGARLHTLAGPRGAAASLAFSPDGRLLASGSNDTTVLLWDATRLRRGAPPGGVAAGVKDLEARWANLSRADAARAYRSMRELIATPRPTVALLEKCLRLEPVGSKRAAEVLADLDSDDLRTREKAAQDLAALGTAAQPAPAPAPARRPPP